MKVVLHSDDINLLSYWEKTFKEDVTIVDNIESIFEIGNSLIIINYKVLSHRVQEVIQTLTLRGNKVLVLDRTPNIERGRRVLSLGAKGYGNALMKEHFLLSAFDAIIEGLVWLHPEFTSSLIEQIPQNNEKDISSFLRHLSEREKEVALLLKEGDTYKAIAEQLNITPRTVKAHANSIYTKLQVKDRLALALLLK